MPLNALANDNWIGRENPAIREASEATRWLSCLGRCCWKQVRLGHGSPDLQQKGITGNTIFFAQPTASIPSMELPPPEDALIESVNIVFTHSTNDLRNAQWTHVKRDEYMKIVRLRRRHCAAYANAEIKEASASTRLPENGVPDSVLNCAQEVEGAANVPVHLSGPASRAPEHADHEDAGDESEDSHADDPDAIEELGHEAATLEATYENIAEATIALDPVHDVAPVKMMQALQGSIRALEHQAELTVQREVKATVADNKGILQPVVDEGGRHCIKHLVLDLQTVARNLDQRGRVDIEKAATGAETVREINSRALAIPVNAPLDTFDARTWPACFVPFWFGDGAPNLRRDRPMLFEQTARMLLEREELEYHLPDDETPYRARAPSRFVTPEITAVLGDVVRRLRLLQGTRAAMARKGFGADLKAIASATAADFMEAAGIAKPDESILSGAGRSDMPAKVKTALRSLLLSTSDVPGTEGRKIALRHDGHANNLFFGAATYFTTPNFADTYAALMVLLNDGPGRTSHLSIKDAPTQHHDASLLAEIQKEEPTMPSLERMHQIGAANPRAQAKFFLFMTELHYRYIVGINELHVGRLTLARPVRWDPDNEEDDDGPKHDDYASSLQPSVAPAAADVQAPFEGQGRGFTHSHGKGHSKLGIPVQWLRHVLCDASAGPQRAVESLAARCRALLETASSVQYESANEPGRQMGVMDLPPEPFTEKQQKQSRMDGGEEDDGARRDFVAVAPPCEQPHIARERCRAAAQSRPPLLGTAAFRELPLTGAYQSSFPVYRQRASFGRLSRDTRTAPQPAVDMDLNPFETDADGQVIACIMPDGREASHEDLRQEAATWGRHYAEHVRACFCVNHEHACVETCIKYQKKQQEAKDSLRKNATPSCRFWFFRVLSIKKLVDGAMRPRRVRRRGKPLVSEPYIETSEDRNDEYRCKVKRDQPFRSASNDVAQACDQSNVDFQYLPCAPLLPADISGCQPDEGALEPDARQGPEKTLAKRWPWLAGVPSSQLTRLGTKMLDSVAAAFRQAHAMDFYITKYQGKMMQSITPLFHAMAQGIRRLEDEEMAAAAAELPIDSTDAEAVRPRKRPKTTAELQRLARRVCIRLASMANRCYWLSTTEVAVHILTGGDCLQSHKNVRLFTRQLQWALQECKRNLNKTGDDDEAPEEISDRAALGPTSIKVRVSMAADNDTAASQPCEQNAGGPQSADEANESDHERDNPDFEVVETTAATTSTNTTDDYAHRGPLLQSMPLYVYRMHVFRVKKAPDGNASVRIPFDAHYILAPSYEQLLRIRADIPTIDGFQCPTMAQDPEQNALLKALLFTPWVCQSPMECGSVKKFHHLLSNCTCKAQNYSPEELRTCEALLTTCDSQPSDTQARGRQVHRAFTFARAWRLRHSEILLLADRSTEKSHAAKKILTLRDTTLCRRRSQPAQQVQEGDQLCSMLKTYAKQTLHRTMPAEAMRRLLAFADHVYSVHPEQPTLAEYCAQVARDVIAHIELAAEARVKKAQKTAQAADDDIGDDDIGEDDDKQAPRITLDNIGNAGLDEMMEEYEEADCIHVVPLRPLKDHHAALHCAFRHGALESLESKSRLNDVDRQLQDLNRSYGPLLQQSFALNLQHDSDGEFTRAVLGRVLRGEAADALALQRAHIALIKKQAQLGVDPEDALAEDIDGAFQPMAEQSVVAVPLPLAMLGPGACAWKLLTDSGSNDEQIDAVALMALSLEKKFLDRPDASSPLLPIATATGNHRAIWLGGGGAGKTRTLRQVVEPLAHTYFGPRGYLPTAQSNHAAHNLGPHGRTLHNANGLVAHGSLQTARLRLNNETQKKMDRLRGEVGIEAIDELGCVPADLLHADALRSTYGRASRHKLNPTDYMKLQEAWGRLAVKILSGDFLQLPPVPATASLLAPLQGRSYEHQQGRALLANVDYVIDFVKMQRFDDPLLREVLHVMRTPGGKKVSEAAWAAIKNTELKSQGDAAQPAATDPRLAQTLDWYEAAYEWRIVSYAMHTKARLRAKAEKKVLFYIQAVDRPALDLGTKDFEAMFAEPNLSTTKKLAGLLPVYRGMEMALVDSILPPWYVPGTVGKVVGIEPHTHEPPIQGRASIEEAGCVLLRFMPKCIYLKIEGSDHIFLSRQNPGAAQPSDLKGVIAVAPKSRAWRFVSDTFTKAIPVTRTQIPLLPHKVSTLHGIQGKTADPGMVAHWKFPRRLSAESLWLAHYVILSRPRRLNNLLSYGLPVRKILEGGPPQSIVDAFKLLFDDKIASTKEACKKAREELGWPARVEV